MACRYGTRNNGEEMTHARRNKYDMQEVRERTVSVCANSEKMYCVCVCTVFMLMIIFYDGVHSYYTHTNDTHTYHHNNFPTPAPYLQVVRSAGIRAVKQKLCRSIADVNEFTNEVSTYRQYLQSRH